MTYRKLLFALLALSVAAALIGCSSSKKVPPVIGVTLSTAPPANMVERTSTSVAATITNDTSANPQVGWTATCANPDCGSFSSLNTGSGTSTTYTAPALMPAGGVTITATSVTDITKSAAATVTITLATTLADGTYVYSLAGYNPTYADDNPPFLAEYRVAGAITVAGGVVTGGEQDYSAQGMRSCVGTAPCSHTASDLINTGGTVKTTTDGNIQIVITTCLATDCTKVDNLVGVAGVETLNGVIVNGNRALINEFDASATSSGELDAQTSTSLGQGGYAFVLQGNYEESFAGVFNVDGSSPDGTSSIDGAGSVFDGDSFGNLYTAEPIDFGNVTAPDSFGRMEITLDLSTSFVGAFGLAAYMVDGNRIRLVENTNDPTEQYAGWYGSMGGTAYFQGANTGAIAAPTADTPYVFGANGANTADPYLQVAGLLTIKALATGATNSGAIAGFLNWNNLTGTTANQAAIPVVGTYLFDDATNSAQGATGRVTLVITDSTTAPTFTYNAQLYLDGNGNATLVSQDNNDSLAGLAFAQTVPAAPGFVAGSVSGNYGLRATGYALTSEYEFDDVGAVAADGVSALASTPAAGSIDQNVLTGVSPGVPTPTAGLVVAGTYTADSAGAGDFTDGMKGLDVTTATNKDFFTYYVIDTTRIFAIETDPMQLTLGYFELQQ
ncbi:MAG TPA: hypothetical protein VEE87_00335 [archaeon]|nr:hypothetical protein [archaeon]